MWWIFFSVVVAVCRAALPPRLRIETLLGHHRTPKGCLEAADLLEKILEEGEDWKLECRAAEAMNHFMRIETKGNTITIDGPLDSPAHKKIWAKHGPRALKHAEKALKEKPDDVRVAAAYADAHMFACSAKGLIKQALTGTGKAFLKNAQRLQQLDDRYDAGLGYTLEGCFYHLAPWPLYSAEKARTLLKKAIDVAPESRRNHYHYAVVLYTQGDKETAMKEFEKCLSCTPRGNEKDFGEFMKKEASRILKP